VKNTAGLQRVSNTSQIGDRGVCASSLKFSFRFAPALALVTSVSANAYMIMAGSNRAPGSYYHNANIQG
jgi:hypothetical protein